MPRPNGLHELWATLKRERADMGLGLFDRSHDTYGLVTEAAAAIAGENVREAATISDFPNILGNLMYRQIVQWYGAAVENETWPQYVSEGSNVDLRARQLILASEGDDLLPVGNGAEYKDQVFVDTKFTITVAPYGRLFSVNREVVINDDLGFLRDTPARLARSSNRTLAKYVVRTLLEGNPNTYDGNALFSSQHTNLNAGTSGASDLTSANLQSAIFAMQSNTADANLNPQGAPLVVRPKFLVVSGSREFSAAALLNTTAFGYAGGAGATPAGFPTFNPIQNVATLIVERWLANANPWYLFADPNEYPALQLNYFREQRVPTVLVSRPYVDTVSGPGGSDPYEVEVDKFTFKIRHHWGGAPATWWGSYKANGV